VSEQLKVVAPEGIEHDCTVAVPRLRVYAVPGSWLLGSAPLTVSEVVPLEVTDGAAGVLSVAAVALAVALAAPVVQ
jgi:hypothetical protein